MNKPTVSSALAAAFALALSGAAFANDPVPNDPAANPAPTETTFDQLDKDGDGYVAQGDIPVEHELNIEFAMADADQDGRLSLTEFNDFTAQPEEEEAEE